MILNQLKKNVREREIKQLEVCMKYCSPENQVKIEQMIRKKKEKVKM
jgi:hypothetical protein